MFKEMLIVAQENRAANPSQPHVPPRAQYTQGTPIPRDTGGSRGAGAVARAALGVFSVPGALSVLSRRGDPEVGSVLLKNWFPRL